MVEKKITVLECNIPKCMTPQDDVERIEITFKRRTYVADLCATDRKAQPVEEVIRYAHKQSVRRRSGIKVVDPGDIPRGRP